METLIIKTANDIKPEEIYLPSPQHKTLIKSTKRLKNEKQSFAISDNDIADKLVFANVIKRDFTIVKEVIDGETCRCEKPTGKYILTPEGIYYIDYQKSVSKSKFLAELRAWITLGIAVLGLILSVIALVVG